MADRTISVDLTAKVDGFVNGFKTAGKAAEDFGNRVNRFAVTHRQDMTQLGQSALVMGGVLAAGLGVAVKAYSDFSGRMAQVKSLSKATGDEMNTLTQAALNMGANIGLSANDVADAETELIKAGVSVKDIMGGALPGALSLAAAGQIEVGKATEIATIAMTQFKLQGKDIPHVADLLAAGADKALGGVDDLGMGLKQGGQVAAQFGLSIDDTVGTLSAFANAGLLGSDAGTSFKTMLLALANPSKKAATTMEELGINAYDAQGKFVGITGLAGQLQEKMKGLSQEQRNAALATIFGTDAIRSASVLYTEGAAGIQKWITSVNDQGFAAVQAAGKMDSLNGDFKKLQAAVTNGLIEMGAAGDGFMRPAVQGLTDLVRGFNDLPQWAKSGTLAIGGISAGALILGGTLLTVIPKIAETSAALNNFKSSFPGVTGAMGKLAVAVPYIGLVATGISLLSNALTQRAPELSAEKLTTAVIELGKASNALDASRVNEYFSQWDHSVGATGSNVSSLASAIDRISHPQASDATNNWADDMFGWTGFIKSEVGQIEDKLGKLGTTMGDLASSGNADLAAESFKKLASEFERNGKTSQDALNYVPAYKDALKDLAAQTNVQLSDQELLDLALGKIPDSMKNAENATTVLGNAAATAGSQTQEMKDALEQVGLKADGTVESLSKLLDGMLATGLATLSSRDATAKFNETLSGVKAKADEIIASQSGLNVVLNKSKTDFDLTTEAGGKANAVFGDLLRAGLSSAQGMAAAGASQQAVQGELTKTYNSVVNLAQSFGIPKPAAEALIKTILNIPKNVNIKTALQDYIDTQNKINGVKQNLDSIPAYKQSRIDIITTQITNAPKGSSKPLAYATGGAVRGFAAGGDPGGGQVKGPGTGTSDSIPALLSNGEHVLTASDVLKLGGQAGVYRLRGLAQAGLLPKFADGGHLGESANARANRLWRAAEAARKARAAELAKSRQYRNEQANALVLDDERGESYRTVASSLSSAYSFSDRLRSVAASGNLNSQRDYLNRVAFDSDKALRNLYARSESLGKSLEAAKGKLQDLTQVKEAVQSKLSGEFNLGQAALFGARSGGGITTVQARASKSLAQVQAFGAKLNALQQKGYAGAILNEIASMGSADGARAADALLAGNSSDVAALNKTYAAIDTAAGAAGTYVTNAMYKGGVNAAQGLIVGLQSQQGAIEKQMLAIGLSMEKALKKSLGIRSPSRKAADITDNFTGTIGSRLDAAIKPISLKSAALGDAIGIRTVPKSPDMVSGSPFMTSLSQGTVQRGQVAPMVVAAPQAFGGSGRQPVTIVVRDQRFDAFIEQTAASVSQQHIDANNRQQLGV